ncbi:MAG: ATP synthase F1 subunit delta [Porcipelethomonas sp.]
MTGDVGKLYAEALFELSLEAGDPEPVYTELNEYNSLFSENPDFVKLLFSPVIEISEKLDIIDRIFGGKKSLVRDFICLVTEKNRITYIDKITSEFNKCYNRHMNIAEMTVVSGIPLKPELREKLKSKLEEKSGKKVDLKVEVDPSIIGGMILRYGNSQIDNSIKGRLEAVAEQLKIQ